MDQMKCAQLVRAAVESMLTVTVKCLTPTASHSAMEGAMFAHKDFTPVPEVLALDYQPTVSSVTSSLKGHALNAATDLQSSPTVLAAR